MLDWVSKAASEQRLEITLGVAKEIKENPLMDKELIEEFLKVTKDCKALVKLQDVVTRLERKKSERGGQKITCTDLSTHGELDALAGKKEAVKMTNENRRARKVSTARDHGVVAHVGV